MKKVELGNPALIAAAATSPQGQEVMKQAAPLVIQTVNRTQRNLRIGGIIVLAGAAIWSGSKFFTAQNKKKILATVNENPNYLAAVNIYNAIPAGLKKGNGSIFNPLGFVEHWLDQIAAMWQKTDTDRILEIARVSINNYQETNKAFKILYDEELTTLLNKVLGTADLQTFMNFTTGFKTNTVEKSTVHAEKIGTRLVTTKDTPVFYMWYNGSSPSASSQLKAIKGSVPKGIGLGTFSGQKVKKILAGNDTEFYISTLGKTKTGKTVFLFTPVSATKFDNNSTAKSLHFDVTSGKQL